MAGRDLPAAKAVLLAVQLARKGDISAFRTIVSQYPKALSFNIVLRILLSHLPETLESAAYVPFIEELASGTVVEDPKAKVDLTSVEEISNADAAKKVKKLHLLPLAWPQAAPDIPQDPLVLFLIHRSLRIDKNTGLLVELPDLLVPFLSRSAYLREWTISTVLPLLRFSYEYHPQDGKALTILEFENLDDRSGVALLLSRTGKATVEDADYDSQTIGRDIRGLVGPWMYGASTAKRQKLRSTIDLDKQMVTPLNETEAEHMQRTGWEEVFKWIVRQGATSWGNAVEAIEQWEGPGDVDLGGYDAGSIWLEDGEQQHLERGYARAALAAAYVVPEESTEALNGVHRILARLITLLDLERLPPLSTAAAFLEPIPSLKESGLLAPENAKYLRNSLLGEENVLTQPKESAIRLIHALLISAYILTKAGLKCTVRKAGELVFFQVEQNQKDVFSKLLHAIKNGPKADDTYWKRTRNEVLWLHNWGAERSEGVLGRGVFGLIKRDFLEAELLKIFLTNTRYSLAKSMFLDIPNPLLSKTQLHDTIIAAAMNAYDNASNANKTRGALKVADDMLKAFADNFKDSPQFGQQRRLIDLTDKLGKFALVLKPGLPFTPVQLRVHEDPVGIIGKLLAQNTGSYTKLDHLLSLGDDMVEAGLTLHKPIVRKRILGMCITTALNEDDFDTAYSYVVGRLQAIGGPAHELVQSSEPNSGPGLSARAPPKDDDEWSWIAAFEAGKHLGNATGHAHIQHLERRIECLICALRLAPKDSVHVVLNVYRRCEEELTSKRQQEAAQEAAWDEQADAQAMPGGFAETPVPNHRTSNRAKTRDRDDEAPMSIFDLSRSTVSRAQKSLSSLTVLNGAEKTRLEDNSDHPRIRDDDSGASTPRSPKAGRKRDIVKSVATDTLASGIGWLIGAPGPTKESR